MEALHVSIAGDLSRSEMADVLRRCAKYVKEGADAGTCCDSRGREVGSFAVVTEGERNQLTADVRALAATTDPGTSDDYDTEDELAAAYVVIDNALGLLGMTADGMPWHAVPRS